MEAAITVNDACGHRLNLLAAQSTSPVSARSISPSETAMTREEGPCRRAAQRWARGPGARRRPAKRSREH
eukprot:9306120-Alexandrium_andersonii.AAC.1